jgi:enoyl-CoA hydratase/carnithine racemase
VAAINGHAYAGGLITALGCDYRIVSEGALQFSLNEVPIGIPVPAVYCEIIKHAVGPRAASELALFGQVYDLGAALKMGVIGKTAAPGRLLDEAVAWAALVPPNCYPAYTFAKTRLAGDDDGRNRRRSAARSRLVIAWHVRSCEPTRARAALPRAEKAGDHLGAAARLRTFVMIWFGS